MSEKDAVALHRLFEGLFVRGLTVDVPLKERLRALGFDLDHPEPRYPVTVWEHCVDAACEALYPGVPRGEAWHRAGRVFIEGYFSTLAGSVRAASLPYLSPKAFVRRGPGLVDTGVEGARAWLEWHDERTATLHVHGAGDESGALLAGVMEGCFERMKRPSPDLQWTGGPGVSTLRITLPA